MESNNGKSMASGKRMTADEVREMVSAHVESSELPDGVLEVFKREQGKQLTKRILAKLPGGEAVWHIKQVASMTSLETWEYTRSQGNRGVHLLVAYETKNVSIDAAFLEERNPAYYGARRERNAERATVLANEPSLVNLAERINAVREAREKLAVAEAALEELSGYGKAFGAEQYEIEALSGKERGR